MSAYTNKWHATRWHTHVAAKRLPCAPFSANASHKKQSRKVLVWRCCIADVADPQTGSCQPHVVLHHPVTGTSISFFGVEHLGRQPYIGTLLILTS